MVRNLKLRQLMVLIQRASWKERRKLRLRKEEAKASEKEEAW